MTEKTVKEKLAKKLKALKEELQEREAALPVHSVRAGQLLVIEELEEQIAEVQQQINALETD